MAQKFTAQGGILQFAVQDSTETERVALAYNDGSTNVDHNFNKVSLLLHFDGVDAATTTTDSSSNVHSPITFAGNAQIDTAQSVFGSSSLLLDGAGDWLTIADDPSWSFGAGDFTIECAVRFAAVGSPQQFVSHYEPTASERSWSFGYDNINGLRFLYSEDGTALTIVDRAWSPSINTQYRVAISRFNNNLYFFIDAVLQGAAEPITATLHNSTHVLTIGAQGSTGTPANPLNGHLDEMRITKGVGRYTASYTLATEAFPNIRTIVGVGLGNTSAASTIVGSAITIEADTTLDSSSLIIENGSLTLNIGSATRIESSDGTDFTTDYSNIGLYNITGSPSIDYTIGTGIVPFRIGGDLGDTTTPYYRFYDTGTNVDRRLAFFSEDGGFSATSGWFVDLRFGPGAPNNSFVVGSTYTTDDLFTIHQSGWSGTPSGNSLRILDSTNTDYIDISHDGTSVHIDTLTTESVIFENTTADFFTLDFTNNRIINNAPIDIYLGGATVFGETSNTILTNALKATFNIDVVGGIVTAVNIDSTTGTGYIDGTGFTFLLAATAGGGDGAAQITYNVVDGSITSPTVSIGGTTYTNGNGQLITASDVNVPEGAGNIYTTIGELHLKAKSGIVNVFGLEAADNTTPDTVTSLLRFKSLDDNLYATLGYAGEDLELIGRAYGSAVNIITTDFTGIQRKVLAGNGDFGSQLFHIGVPIFNTAPTGIQIQGVTVNNPGTGGVQDQLLEFVNSGIQPTASLGFAAGTALRLINIVDGGALDFRATSAGGVLRNVILGDPDTDVKLYNANTEVARTLAAASGGWEVNNTVTGAGFERVLTTSDIFTTASTPLNLIGDINTATPPTTEAITNLLQFRDLADDDTIGSIGYTATNDLIITNNMRGGTVQIEQVDAAGVTRPIMTGDADGGVDIYHPNASTGGLVRLRTIASGNVYLMADTNSDSANALLNFTHQSTTNLGSIGNTATEFIVRSDVPSKSVTLIGERSTAANVDLAEFDPDLGAFIGAAQFTRLTTQLSGIVGIRSDANSDTENRLLSFQYQDTTVRATIGQETGSPDLAIRNLITAGIVRITAQDTGDTEQTILIGDPDALTILRGDTGVQLQYNGSENMMRGTAGLGVSIYYNNTLRFGTSANGISVQSFTSTDVGQRTISFEHQDGTVRAVIGHEGDDILAVSNQIDGGNVLITAQDSGSTLRTILTGDPDAITTLTGDTELRFISAAVEASRIQAATVQTTIATVTEIIAIAVASGEGFGFEIHCMGTEDSTGDTVFERVFGAIRNQGGTTALVGSTVTDRTDDAGASAWAVTVAADDTTDELTVDVTGEAATTIDWKIRVHLLNV